MKRGVRGGRGVRPPPVSDLESPRDTVLLVLVLLLSSRARKGRSKSTSKSKKGSDTPNAHGDARPLRPRLRLGAVAPSLRLASREGGDISCKARDRSVIDRDPSLAPDSASKEPLDIMAQSVKANDLRAGDKIEHDNDIWLVREVEHRTPGNLRAFVQAKITSIKSGRSKEERFRSTDVVKMADIENKKMQFLYAEDDVLIFMDSETFDQMPVRREILGDAPGYLLENMEVQVSFLKGQAAGIELPASVILTVVQTDPGVRGDTVNSVLKPATMETGLVVQVPIFVNEGDKLKVDTRTGAYLQRA